MYISVSVLSTAVAMYCVYLIMLCLFGRHYIYSHNYLAAVNYILCTCNVFLFPSQDYIEGHMRDKGRLDKEWEV